MASLGKFFSKYKGELRSWKVVYSINNFLNSRKLKHNRELYKKLGLQKSIFGSIKSSDFGEQSVISKPWLDLPGAKEALTAHPDYQSFDADTQQQLLDWLDNGFLILKGFYKSEEIDTLNQEVDRLLAKQEVDFNFTGRKVMDAHQISPIVDGYFKNQKILRLLNFIMGRTVYPFQTINFVQGSEQRAHSDSIHMTSEPKGYLIATWTALENCHEGNGPLFYYPGSHKLPYVMSDDFESGHSKWKLGANSYKKYEDKIAEVVEKNNLQKQYFHAEKGDVLFWHANLLHGGSPITKEGSTRRSMVAHYFCENVVCYHEISQRPALLG